jgi:hypothetical protein
MGKLKKLMILFDVIVLVLSAWLIVIPIIALIGLIKTILCTIQDVLIQYLKLVKKECLKSIERVYK